MTEATEVLGPETWKLVEGCPGVKQLHIMDSLTNKLMKLISENSKRRVSC